MPSGEGAAGAAFQEPEKSTTRQYTWEEVAKHNRPDDCWTVIDGKVYDMSKFVKRHPGGKIILASSGVDGTCLYEIHHPFSSKPDMLLNTMQIGVIADKNYYPRSPFYAELLRRLKAKGYDSIHKLRDNKTMMFKAAILFTLWWFTYKNAYLNSEGSYLWSMLHGVILALIGMDVMHDGNHKGTSVGWFNTIAGETMSWIGGNSQQWTFGHILHHAAPNQDIDPDTLQSPLFLRYREDQPFHWHMRFQHIYAWFLYTVVFLRKRMQSFEHIFNPQDFGGIWLPPPTKLFHAYTTFAWFSSNVVIMTAIPIYHMGFWNWIGPFLAGEMVGGWLLAAVFQINHITIDTELRPGTLRDPKVDWAIDQVVGSNNFTQGHHLSWTGWLCKHLTGGLGYQVEHHLFPTASDVQLHLVADVLKQLCEERGVRYVMHSSVWEAMKSHYRLLTHCGRDYYNKRITAQDKQE